MQSSLRTDILGEVFPCVFSHTSPISCHVYNPTQNDRDKPEKVTMNNHPTRKLYERRLVIVHIGLLQPMHYVQGVFQKFNE